MLLSVCFHKLPNIVAADVSVLKDWAHLAEFLFKVICHANVHFHTPKQTLISHLAQNSLRVHDVNFVEGSSDFRGDKSL